MKNWIVVTTGVLVMLVLGVSLFLHLYKIDTIPYGFHVDELSQSVTVECVAKEGVDAHNNRYPLFFQTGYGSPRPPTYIYPAILWGEFQGFTVPSLRAYGVVVHFIGIIGLYFLGRVLFGHTFGLWVAFVAGISPWLWPTSRVAIESLFAPTFSIWALYFFFRKQTYFYWTVAGLLFCASMYSYPAMRLQVPIMLLTLWIYSLRKMKTSFGLWVVFALSLGLPLLPLVIQTLHGGAVAQRFNAISIAAPEFLKSIGKTNSIKDLTEIFISNFQQHLSLDYLFLKGDPSLVHSTGHFGILSWLDVGALILCIVSLLFVFIKPLKQLSPWHQNASFLILLLANIFLAIIPSAITNSEIPHALRMDGGWPFLCLLTAFFMYELQKRYWPLGLAALFIGILFMVSFSKIYFGPYQQESKGMFDYWSKEQADAARTETDWLKFRIMHYGSDYHFRYFMMNYRHEACTASRLDWENQMKMLKSLNFLH